AARRYGRGLRGERHVLHRFAQPRTTRTARGTRRRRPPAHRDRRDFRPSERPRRIRKRTRTTPTPREDRPDRPRIAKGSLLDNDIGWVFDRGRMYGPREDGNHLYALTTCVAYDLMALKNAEAADRPVAALRVGYPNARDAEVLDVTVVAWPKVTFLIEGGHVH